MSRLGKLAVKLAAAPGADLPRNLPGQPTPQPGLLDRLMQAHKADMGAGRYATTSHVGPTPGQMRGMVTGQQALLEGAGSIAGPLGQSAAIFGLPYITQATKAMGLDLNAPIQTSYGGSTRAAWEMGQVQSTMMPAQLRSMGTSANRIISTLGQQLKRAGAPDSVVSLVSGAASASPEVMGQILQQATMMFPQTQAILSRLDPHFITDFTPLVNATYYLNNGEFDPETFNRLQQEFQRAYAEGDYAGIPAQVAVHSMAYAAEQGVPEGALTRASANASMAANAYIERGLAKDFGSAMQLAQSVDRDLLVDPSKAMQGATYYDNLARRTNMKKEDIAAGAQMAAQNGWDAATTMQAVGASGRVRKALGDRAGNYAGVASNALAQFQHSHRAQVMGALMKAHPQARPAILSAIKSGDETTLAKLYDQNKHNARIQTLVRAGGPQLGVEFAREVTQTNPGLYNRVVMTEARDAAKGNKELGRLLNNRNELIAALRTGDLTKYSPATQAALMRGGGALGAVALASRPDSEPLPEPVGYNDVKPFRIGVPYPTAKGPAGGKPLPIGAPDFKAPPPPQTGKMPAALRGRPQLA